METDQFQITEDQASALINGWREYPQTFFENVLGVEKIWKLQDDLLSALPRAINEHKPIYVASGHGLGKDYICGGVGPWFLYSYSPSIVILTGPTDRQVKNVMWAETLGHWNRRKVDLGGKAFTEPRIEIRKEDWYLIGFTTKESGAGAKSGGGKFQGFHAPNVCVIVTEAQAVEDNIYDQIDAVTTNENVLVIYIGNPTRASGRFAKGLRDKKNNIVFNFSCLDNPNYKHKKTIIPGLCSYKWVEDKRKKWGEGDPRWQGRVLGQVPDSSIDSVFTQELIDLGLSITDTHGLRHNNGVALDVAGEGLDENVLMGGQRGVVKDMKATLKTPPSTNAINAVEMCEEMDGQFIVVDCDGMGIKEYQELNKMPGIDEKYHIIKFHGSARIKRDTKVKDYQYFNLRAKAWFTAKERLENGLASIPDDEELIEELLEVKFFENKYGQIQIEDKDDIKERLDRSPDRADAWVMLQWGFSQNLEPLIIDKKHDPYSRDREIEEYPFNPATV